jgi:hypothetical protein
MTLIKKYFWVILIVVAFALGILISPKPDKTLIQKFETEREVSRQLIEQKEARIQELTGVGQAIREKAYQDSVKFSDALKAKDKHITNLTRKINELDFKNATTEQLDSVSHALYGSNALPAVRN